MEATESAPAAGAHVAEAKPAITYKRHGDKSIWGIFITLCIISVIELYSASSREVAAAGVYGPIMRHCFLLGMGVCIVLLLERLHYKAFFACAWVIAFLSMGMMLYVTLFGEIVNGARRSFSLMGITIQPSEFIKLSAVLVIAQIMSKSQRPKAIGVRTQGVVLSAIMVLLFGGLL
ncbi:FtsW/RodA/SpoVE family cell cycle protein, partial [uncultured Muribaculum sp.]